MGYIGNQSSEAYSSVDKQVITGNGGTAYTLSHSVANANEIEVFVNNVRQEPGVAYTVSAGTSLAMTGNVASTDDFYVVFQGKAVQTATHPSDAPLTASQINADNIRIDGNTISSTNTNGDITLDPNGTGDTVVASGNVGIGTNSPARTLTVDGSGNRVASITHTAGTYAFATFSDANTSNDGSVRVGALTNDLVMFSGGSETARLLSGGGLTFNGDTAAANALDDYEQGTWTPSVGGSATYTTQAGHYIKIGDMVFITGTLAINNISGAAHTNYLDGLPYNSVAGNGREGFIGVQYFANLASSGTYFALRTNGDRLYGSAQRENDNTMVINPDIFTNSTEVSFGGSYFVA